MRRAVELNHVAYSEHPARAALSVCCWSHPVTPLGVALYRSARGAPLSVRSRLARVKVGSRRRRALCGGSALALPTRGNLPDTLVSTRYIVISNRGPGQVPRASFLNNQYRFLDPTRIRPFAPSTWSFRPATARAGRWSAPLRARDGLDPPRGRARPAARGVSCRGRSRTAAAPPTPVDAIGRDRARPAIPAGATIETRSTWRTPGQVADGSSTRPEMPSAGGRLAAVGAPRCAPRSIRPLNARLQGGPQPPAARSASNGAQGASPGVGVVSTGRSGGRSTLPTALMWPVISASMCRCRRVSTGPAARRAAHQPARGAAQGPPAIPPAPPLSSRPPARAGGPIGTRARAFWEFHRKGKRGTMGKGLRGKAKSENGRSADPPQRRNG